MRILILWRDRGCVGAGEGLCRGHRGAATEPRVTAAEF
jgi:hypothetical protein